MIVDALVLAGGKLESDFAGHVDVPHKALIPIGGRTMIERVLDALQESPSIGAIALVEPESGLPEEILSRASAVARGGATMIASLQAGLQAFDELPDKVLAVACDLPFLTPQAVDDYVARCLEREADVHYCFVDRRQSDLKYPNLRHTWVRLKEGTFCGGGAVMLTPSIITNAQAIMDRLTAARKRPWELALTLGLSLLVKLPLGLLTVREAEEKAAKLFGCRVAGVESAHAEISFNVDGPEELSYARRMAGE